MESGKKFEIKIDIDRNPGYEINSVFKRIFNFFFIPILNNLPPSFKKIIQKSNRAAHHVLENVTTHEALEALYNEGKAHPHENFIHYLARYFWFNLNNSKAVRNRLKLVSRELKNKVSELSVQNREVRILSIASGSARSVIEVLKQVDVPRNKISVSFLDINNNALQYSKLLVGDLGKSYNFRWINDSAFNFPSHFAKDNLPNIIEMVGLLDYFDDERVKRIFNLIKDNIADDGYLITANILDNNEKKFVTKVVGWEMIYRKAEELAAFIEKSGFKKENIKVFYEPLRVHSVIVAKK